MMNGWDLVLLKIQPASRKIRISEFKFWVSKLKIRLIVMIVWRVPRSPKIIGNYVYRFKFLLSRTLRNLWLSALIAFPAFGLILKFYPTKSPFKWLSFFHSPGLTCPLCNKRFQCRRNRDRHFDSVHLKLKNFKCPLCEHRYSQKVHLKGHMKRIHHFVYDDSEAAGFPEMLLSLKKTSWPDWN